MLARSVILRQLLAPKPFLLRNTAVQYQMANFSLISEQQRFFAKKKRFGKSSKSGEESGAASEAEPEDAPVHHEEPAHQAANSSDWLTQANRDSLDAPKMDQSHF